MTIKWVKITLLAITGVAAALALGWYAIFGLKPYQVSSADINSRYSYHMARPTALMMEPLDKVSFTFSYSSFDGAMVHGQIRYPRPLADINAPVPVLIGVHAMGRSYLRWWQAQIDARPTLENTDKITALALEKGYAVVTIDARLHGARKLPYVGIRSIYQNLHWWGQRGPYEHMIVDTVRDHRVLLDILSQQPQLDASRIHIAGYSMGAHVSLLLASVDERINKVAAIVPPYLDNKVAIVAPLNLLAGLADNTIWLLSGNDDEHASKKQNQALFSALPGLNKQHITFDSGHILPQDYVQSLEAWF
jgi:predicted esterase